MTPMTDVVTAGAARYAGHRINRVEDARLLTGTGIYVDDIALPGMLHACFVRSPLAKAKIRGVDTSAALALPGVRHVFTGGRSQSGGEGAVAHRAGTAGPRDPASAAGLGGGAFRWRSGRPRPGREPLSGRGRRGSGRGEFRPTLKERGCTCSRSHSFGPVSRRIVRVGATTGDARLRGSCFRSPWCFLSLR